MKTKYGFACSILVLMLALVACEPEQMLNEAPEYYGTLQFTKDAPSTITLDNQNKVKTISSCSRGDSVTVFMPVLQSGAYITYAIYYWSVKNSTGEELSKNEMKQIAPHKHSCPPLWTFRAPGEAGSYEVHFRATYDFHAQGPLFGGYPTTLTYEGASTVSAKLVVQ